MGVWVFDVMVFLAAVHGFYFGGSLPSERLCGVLAEIDSAGKKVL